MTAFMSTRRGRRVLICVRGQCAESNRGRRLEKRLLELIEQYGLDDLNHPLHVSCAITNCLGVCADGPVMIVHPEAIKYHHVTEAALERIFQQHLLGNQPVEELIVREPPVRPILPKHKL
jgi:(2Fe-2S) ferredoxin